jgi:nucleoside-diphosphate kinase
MWHTAPQEDIMTERTFAIIKPDVVSRGKQGLILDRILSEGFRVLGMKQVSLTRAAAEGFYAVHRGRPFFDELCDFMSSGPVVVLSLERENAVQKWRDVIGATNPANAAPGTVRQAFGTGVCLNAVHGSDSVENGRLESSYFFSSLELLAFGL